MQYLAGASEGIVTGISSEGKLEVQVDGVTRPYAMTDGNFTVGEIVKVREGSVSHQINS